MLKSKNSTRAVRMFANITTSIAMIILILRYPFDQSKFGAFIPIIGENISQIIVEYNILFDVLIFLAFFFALIVIYDAILIYLANRKLNFVVSTEKNSNGKSSDI